MGSVDLFLDHVTLGCGYPSTVHFKIAVWPSLTVFSAGGSMKKGAEIDLPCSPFWPFSPRRPLGPGGPTFPCTPGSPFIPIGPGIPWGPCFPGLPCLPRRPGFPRGPARHNTWSLAQIWFCKSRSSSRISSCIWESVTVGLTCLIGDEILRLCLKLPSFLPKRVSKQ